MKGNFLRQRCSRIAMKLPAAEAATSDTAEAATSDAAEAATSDAAEAAEEAAAEAAAEAEEVVAVVGGYRTGNANSQRSGKSSRTQGNRIRKNSREAVERNNARKTSPLAAIIAQGEAVAEASDATSASDSSGSRSSSSRTNNSRRSSTTSCGSSSPSSGTERTLMGGKKKKRKVIVPGRTTFSSASSADAAALQATSQEEPLLHKQRQQQNQRHQPQQQKGQKKDEETVLRNRVQTRRGAGSLVSRPATICCGGAVICIARGESTNSNSNNSNSCTRNSSSNSNSENSFISVDCRDAFDVCAVSTRSGRFLYACRGHSAAITAILPLPEEAAAQFRAAAAAAASLCLTASLDGTLRLWWTPAHALEQQQLLHMTEQQQQQHLRSVSGRKQQVRSVGTDDAAAASRENKEKHSSSSITRSSSSISSGAARGRGSNNELLTICLHTPIIGAAYAAATREVFLLLQMAAEDGQQQQRKEEAAVGDTPTREQTVVKAAMPQRKSISSRNHQSSSTRSRHFSCCYGVCTMQLDEVLACYTDSKKLLQQTPSLLLKTVLGFHAAEAEDPTERETPEEEEDEKEVEEEGATAGLPARFSRVTLREKRNRLLSSSLAGGPFAFSSAARCSSSTSSISSHSSSSAAESSVWGPAAAAAAAAEECDAAAAAAAMPMKTAQVDVMDVGAAAVAVVYQMQREARGHQLFRFTAVPTAFTVSSSGQYAAVACGKQVLLYNKPQERLLVLQHDQQLLQIVIHPEDQFLAAGDFRGRIALWFGLSSKRFLAAGVRSPSNNSHQQQRQVQQQTKRKDRGTCCSLSVDHQAIRQTPTAALSKTNCVEETTVKDCETNVQREEAPVSCCYCDAAAAEATAAAAAALRAAVASSFQNSFDASKSRTSSVISRSARSFTAAARLLAAVDRPAATATVTAAAAVLARVRHVVWSKGNADNALSPGIFFDTRKQPPGNAQKLQRHGAVAASTVLHWHAHAVAALAFSADGLLLLSGGEEGVLVLWQMRHAFQKQFLPRLGAPILHISSCAAAAAADGGGRAGGGQQQQREGDSSRWAAVSCADNSIKLVDTFYLRVDRVIQGIDIPISNFFFSPREEAAAAAAARAALAALAAATEKNKCGLWKEKQTRRAVAWTEEEPAATVEDVLGNEETRSQKSLTTVHAAAERDAMAFSIAKEILLQQEEDTAAGARCFICPLSLSPFFYAVAAASSPCASFPSYTSSPAAAAAAKQQLLLLQRRGVHTPWFLQRGVLQQQQDGKEGKETEGTLLLGTQGSRLQIYDSRTDHHLLHLLLRPHRMYASRINEAFGHTWQTQLAAADCCCSCLAVVETRDCVAAFQDTKALEAAVLRNKPQTLRDCRSTGKSSNHQRDLFRLEDELIYHPQQRSFCLSFWVYQQEGKQGTASEEARPEPFVLRTRVEDCHVNEITALQPHSKMPRFFFSLSLDTTFKAWREVVSPSPTTTEGASGSSNNSFFSCILEGSFRCMQPLCCALSTDASLLVISHGRLLTLWNPHSFDLLHFLPVPTAAAASAAADAAAASSGVASGAASESSRCSSRNSARRDGRREGSKNSSSVEEERRSKLMLCSAEEKCEQLGLLEGIFGMHAVAATAAVVFIYDLLSFSLCWMKSFLHDEGSLIDFLFVEPGPGQQFGVVLAAVYPDSSSKTDSSSRRARARSPAVDAAAPFFATSSINGEPVHDVRVYAFRSINKTVAEDAAATRHPLLPLQPVLGPLEAAEAAAPQAGEHPADAAAKAAKVVPPEAAAGATGQEEALERVEVACVFQQIRRGTDDAVVAGAFAWPLPPPSAAGAAAGGSQDVERSQRSEIPSCNSSPYEAHNSTLMLLTAGYHIDVVQMQQETVSVVEGAAAAAATKKAAAAASERARLPAAADSAQEKELLVPAAAEGDIEIHMLESPASQLEDSTPARRQRPLQQLLHLQHVKQQIEKGISAPQDQQAPPASSLATLFCRSKSRNSSSSALAIDRGAQQNLLLLPTEAAIASHAAAPPSVLLERFIDAAAQRAPAPPVETDEELHVTDEARVAGGLEEQDAGAADTAAADRSRGPAPVQRASRTVLAALARRSHGRS